MSDNKIENSVMSEINSGKVKLRSKFIFLVERFGFKSVIVLGLLLSILLFNLFLFYLKASDNLHYLSFGSRGFFAFLESFPYYLMIFFLVIIVLVGLLLRKTNLIYSLSYSQIAVCMVCIVFIFGLILSITSLAERIEQRTYSVHPDGMIFRPLLHQGWENRQRGIAGRISELKSDSLIIETPGGLRSVLLDKIGSDISMNLVTGTFVMIIGEREGDNFHAEGIRIMNEHDMPMVGRSMAHRFPPPPIK